MRSFSLALAVLLATAPLAYAQQNRSQLNTFNAQNFNANGRNGVTGPTLNNMNGQFITSFGALNDTNPWHGLNTFDIPINPASGGSGALAATCNGSTNVTSAFGSASFYTIPQVTSPLTNYCLTTIAQNAFPNMAALYGSGRVKDAAGNLRGPFYSTVSTLPAVLGNYNTNQLQAFNADWSHTPIAIEANIIGTALGPVNSAYTLGRQTSSIFIRSLNSAGWSNGLNGAGNGRSGQGSILVDFTNTSPGGDMTPFWFEGFVTGVQQGATQFGANAAITGPAGQLKGGANGVYMEPYGDLDCIDGGFDDACMSVINLTRDNATGNLNVNDVGSRIQSVGAAPIDAFFAPKGPTSIGIDLTAATFPDGSSVNGPAPVSGGTNYAVGDLVAMAGGTCDQTPTFIVKTISGSAIATLGIERKGMCSAFPSNPATLTTVTGAGSGATATIATTLTSNAAIALTANQFIYFNAFQDASAWTSGLPSTTWLGGSSFGYKAGAYFLVNNGKILLQGDAADVLIPSTVTLKAQGGRQVALREITSGTSNTAGANDDTIVWRSATASPKAQTIPACASGINGQTLTVKDGQNTAAANNITITPASGTIEGGASLVMTVNRQSVQLECDGTATDWIKLN